MNKKLVQINTVCNGSTGRIMEHIQSIATKNGYDAYSFYGRGKPSNEKCIKIGNTLDIYWNIFLTRILDRHGYGSKRATKKMIREIEKIQPDIIQLHNIHGYYLNLKILFNYLKESKIPVVWTLHDCWAFTGHCSYFIVANCDKWKQKCKNCIQKRTYPKSFFIDNSKKQYNAKKEVFNGVENLTIITPSNWLANLVKESFLNNYEVRIINNGIDLDVFKPTNTIDVKEKYNIPKNKYIILGVAAVWNERKGLNDFIELSKFISNSERIVLVGLNKKQINRLPKNIIGIERTENVEELANLYTSANIFLNPTYEDNFPTTNLEALACGIPIITYNIGGSAESVSCDCGYITNKGNIKELYNKLEKVRYSKLGKNKILERAHRYSKDDKYNEYINIYCDVKKCNNI